MDIVNTYLELGSYRGAADLCGVEHKTVKRVVQRWRVGTIAEPRKTPVARPRNTDCVESLIGDKVAKTRGRITAKRLLPQARAAGYEGSARNFRRAVARAKARWARSEHNRRPWVPSPGEHLVIDWGEEGPLKIFCAVLAWSRYRFVRFATNMKRETTLTAEPTRAGGTETIRSGDKLRLSGTRMERCAGRSLVNRTTWVTRGAGTYGGTGRFGRYECLSPAATRDDNSLRHILMTTIRRMCWAWCQGGTSNATGQQRQRWDSFRCTECAGDGRTSLNV